MVGRKKTLNATPISRKVPGMTWKSRPYSYTAVVIATGARKARTNKNEYIHTWYSLATISARTKKNTLQAHCNHAIRPVAGRGWVLKATNDHSINRRKRKDRWGCN